MSDTSQGPGWWQASDGRWYPPEQSSSAPATPAAPTEAAATAEQPPASAEQPPAPGWWKASDGNWYPPAGEAPATPTTPAAPEQPTPSQPTQPAPSALAPTAPPAAAKSSGAKPLLLVGGIFVVLVLIAAGIFVARRGSDDTGAGGRSGNGAATNGGGGNDGGSGTGGGNGPLAAASDDGPDKSITLTDDVVVVHSKGGSVVKSLGQDGKSLTLDASAEGVDKLDAGKILLLTGVTVVRVKSVDKSGDGVTVTAEPVTLPEVIKDGEITWNDQPVDPTAGRLTGFGGGGSDSGDGGSSDTSEDPTSGIDINGGITGGVMRPPSFFGEGESAAGAVVATQRIPTKTISGKAADFSFDITHEAEGSGHHLDLKLKSDGDVKGTIEADIHLRSLANSGHVKVGAQKLQNFDFSFADLGGTATITGDLQGLSDVAKVSTPPFFKLPFSIEFPMPLGGIPFTLSLTGTIQVTAVFSIGNSSLQGRAEITYDGDAGFHFKGGSVSLDGKRTQDAPDLLKTLKGVTPGPVGLVFTTELPKIGFGFGFLQTGAGIYISNGMVASQTILPPPAICTAENVAYVLAGGVEGKFLGKEFEIARKAFVKKEWNYQQPASSRCNAPK